MEHFINGIGLGMSLSLLVGPLLFALISVSIENGFRAGILVAGGIWASDFLFIVATYWGLSLIAALTDWQYFEATLSVCGGVVLLISGIGIFFSKPNTEAASLKSHASYFIKGFLLNTINPFTVFFWFGIVSGFARKSAADNWHLEFFILGIFLTIILTDSLKVTFAKKLRQWLTERHIFWVRRISGLALMAFGVALAVKYFLK
jgi:threonine/homoserine/homoserine lactone efflux protein